MADISPPPSSTGGLPRTKLAILISSLLVSGVCNSMLNKYQDMQVVDQKSGKTYEQPVFQTFTMFIGETFCLIAFQVVKHRHRLISRNKTSSSRNRQGEASSSRHGRYAKIPSSDIVDSGVVLNDNGHQIDYNNNASSITMRTVVEDLVDDEEEQEEETRWSGRQQSNGGSAGTSTTLQDDEEEENTTLGLHAKKAVVGPDELIPVIDEGPEPKLEEKLQGTKQLLMWLPAIFDICATTLMNVGLLWVPVSVYQMLRGALVLFVGLFSVLFLGRRLPLEQWLSLFVVMSGIAVVGLSNALSTPSSPSAEADVGKAVAGAALVLFAQIFAASQFVIEEKILTRYELAPLKAVGLEGIFGLSTTAFAMPILFFMFGRSASSSTGNGGYFDIPNGLHETFSSPQIWVTSIFIAFSIAAFNFAGLAVTKTISATARSLLDCCRTVGIWICSLLLGWEQLAPLQILGFALLVYGTLCFNDVVSLPFFRSSSSKISPNSNDNNGKIYLPRSQSDDQMVVPSSNYGSSSGSESARNANANSNGKIAVGGNTALRKRDDDEVSERTSLLGDR